MTRNLVVALAGAPNAGKSTLLNNMIGQQISIVTHKVQTTRHSLRGIVHDGEVEMIFIDTPGLFEPKRTLERAIVSNALNSLHDADVVCILFDATKLKRGDYQDILTFFHKVQKPLIAVITKIDLLPKPEILPLMSALNELEAFKEIIPLSALKSVNTQKFIEVLKGFAKNGPWLYQEDEVTDQPLRVICEEITRKQSLILLHQELPYSMKVETEKWLEDEEMVEIYQALFVTKESQKVIALGDAGSKIKEIGRRARMEMGKLMGKRVRLFLYIKVRENWIERDFGNHI
jgi:GTP-binding protein Era